jgi:hypothetical protein
MSQNCCAKIARRLAPYTFEQIVTKVEEDAKITEMTSKVSESEKVDAYMGRLKHPLAKLAEDLGRIILSADKEIGEKVKWNAPTFFFVLEK